MHAPGRGGYRTRTERKDSPLMAPTPTLELELVVVGTPHNDNSGLRARLSGQTVEPRSIEAELRAAMHERTASEVVLETTSGKRWR